MVLGDEWKEQCGLHSCFPVHYSGWTVSKCRQIVPLAWSCSMNGGCTSIPGGGGGYTNKDFWHNWRRPISVPLGLRRGDDVLAALVELAVADVQLTQQLFHRAEEERLQACRMGLLRPSRLQPICTPCPPTPSNSQHAPTALPSKLSTTPSHDSHRLY